MWPAGVGELHRETHTHTHFAFNYNQIVATFSTGGFFWPQTNFVLIVFED